MVAARFHFLGHHSRIGSALASYAAHAQASGWRAHLRAFDVGTACSARRARFCAGRRRSLQFGEVGRIFARRQPPSKERKQAVGESNPRARQQIDRAGPEGRASRLAAIYSHAIAIDNSPLSGACFRWSSKAGVAQSSPTMEHFAFDSEALLFWCCVLCILIVAVRRRFGQSLGP